MAKKINTPIDITVEPRIRAIMRRNRDNPDEPLEVVDIQNLIRAVSHYVNNLHHRIVKLEDKIIRQKHKLTDYENVIKYMKQLLLENEIEFNGENIKVL